VHSTSRRRADELTLVSRRHIDNGIVTSTSCPA